MAERTVRFLGDQREAALQVDVPRGGERVVRPQDHPAVAGGARESHAVVDERAAEPVAAAVGVDEEEAQLGRVRILARDAEHASHAPPVALGEPRGLAARVAAGGVVGHDAGHERLHRLVPAELLGVELAVDLDDPPEVAGAAEGPDAGRRC